MPFDTATIGTGIIVMILLFNILPIWIVSKIKKQSFFDIFKTIFWYWLIQLIIGVIAIGIFGFTTSDVAETASMLAVFI